MAECTFQVGEAYGALEKFRYPKILVEGPRGTSKSRSILSFFLGKLLEYPGSRLLLSRRWRTDLTKTILTTLEDEVFPAFSIPCPGGADRTNRSFYKLDNGSMIWPTGIDDGMGILSMGITFAYVAEVLEMTEEMVTDIAGGLRWLKSPGPNRIASKPGTAAMASTCSRASGDSICSTTIFSVFEWRR